jgi:hypothetical protein
VGQLLRVLGELGCYSQPVFDACLSKLRQECAQVTAEVVVDVLVGCAHTQHVDDAAFGELLHRLRGGLPRLSAGQCSEAVWALQQLGLQAEARGLVGLSARAASRAAAEAPPQFD